MCYWFDSHYSVVSFSYLWSSSFFSACSCTISLSFHFSFLFFSSCIHMYIYIYIYIYKFTYIHWLGPITDVNFNKIIQSRYNATVDILLWMEQNIVITNKNNSWTSNGRSNAKHFSAQTLNPKSSTQYFCKMLFTFLHNLGPRKAG